MRNGFRADNTRKRLFANLLGGPDGCRSRKSCGLFVIQFRHPADNAAQRLDRSTSVAVLANGTIAALYDWNDGSVVHTSVNFYNEAGQQTGNRDLGITPIDPGAYGVGTMQIVAGKTGGFLVLQGAVPTSGGGKDFFGATFDASGNVVAPWQQLTTGVQVATGWSVSALANGGYTFFWDQSNNSGVLTLRLTIMKAKTSSRRASAPP